MPTYEYACRECGHRFDIWQEVGSPAPTCEKCNAETKKVFQPPRVIFKGSGFYVTDLRNEKSGNSGGGSSEKSEAGSSESKGEPAKTETKSESKSESKSDTPTPHA